jgi:GNAT superfamily N-acetyltransferase
MNLKFSSALGQKQGTIANLLKQSYAELISSEPYLWGQEKKNWEQFDRDVFEYLDTIGASVFLSWKDDHLVGLGSYDPRQKPELGIVGHNCIIPDFRRKGFGKLQIYEILDRFRSLGIQKVIATTNEHPFFYSAQRLYISCGFQEYRRYAGGPDFRHRLIDYTKNLG